MKKTKDSWFFFVLYSITYLMLGACGSNLLSEALQLNEMWQVVALTAGMLVCAGFLFGLLRAFGVRLAVRRGRKSYRRKEPSFFVAEILPIILMYAVTLLARVWTAHEGALGVTGDEMLFLDAGMEETYYGNFRYNTFGVLLVYRWMLRSACLIFGNDPLAVFALNTVLQLLVVLLGYLLLRLFLNKKAAIGYAVLWNVLPGCYAMLPMADVAVLYVLILIIALLFTAMMCRERKNPAHYPVVRKVLCALCGIVTGYLLIGHISYVLVFVTGLVLLAFYSQNKKADYLCYGIGWLVGVLAVMLTGAIAFSVQWDFAGLVQGAKAYLTSYMDLYIPHMEFLVELSEQSGWTYSLIVVLMLSGLLIFLMYKNERETLRLFGPAYIGTALMCFVGFDRMINGEAVLVGVSILLISVGFGMIFTMKNPLEKNVAIVEAEMPEEVVSVTAAVEPAVNEEQPKPVIQFIENPLPLPKKHVRKEMDYQYEVPQEKMNYDVAVDETDDFDIR